jgi:hypothetical protein
VNHFDAIARAADASWSPAVIWASSADYEELPIIQRRIVKTCSAARADR